MKKNFNAPLLTIEGAPIPKSAADQSPWPMSHAIANALLNHQEQRMTAETSLARLNLARLLLSSEGEIEITSEQAVEIKKIIPTVYPPLIAGQIVELIEQ